MRVITGKYKGRHFDVPRTFKARPTTDFAKENLFNVLRAYIDFPSTRALELLSRGCPLVVSVEKDRQHFSFISAVLRKLDDPAARPYCGDALRFVARCREQFDLIFADPPYALPELAELPDRVMQSSALAPDGIFVLEHGDKHDFSARPDFLAHRAYGSVNFSFFRRPQVADEA